MAGTSQGQEFAMSEPLMTRSFEPTAATASMFLYAQGSTIICCNHDTLAIERRFSRHAEEVQLLAVDNQSEHGRGRLVVSYDAGQTAIVWDLLTGDEVARFVSFEPLTVAAWMRNGNVVFGNAQGSIILFEPPTSEHLSSRTLDQIRVTALAPASDCRTFAIGYQNGSLLIATLQPRFTILHNLSTARGPSPIVTLAWHASASRQRSDMLASQTHDGDLRVWSVAKSYNSDDPAKVVRILKRTENYVEGPNWMAWSKNGRIIQYSDGQTVSWDVRTKHVTYDQIPTLEGVRGLAVYGPGATLFTLGDNNSVQQFDLNTPSILVANAHHPNILPPSPPVSVEEQDKPVPSTRSESTVPTIEMQVTSSDEERAIMRNRDLLSASDRYDTSSPSSSQSGSSLGNHARAPVRHPSMISRAQTDITYISGTASSMWSQSQQPPQQQHSQAHPRERDLYSTSTRSLSSKSSTTRSRGNRLRNDLGRQKVAESGFKDLFKFTRARLSDLSYRLPTQANNTRLTNDDLRRQMLSTIFGWNGEIDDLIRDERSRHPTGSSCRMLLSRWLGEEDTDMFQNNSENMTDSDWMLLALSGIGNQASQHKLGRAYVQRLLGEGDVHAAVTIMLALGDDNDAIEIYVSHRKYMEALILTCLSFPAVWERQAAIIKKWGEYAVQHGQQQLAIRCLTCTDQESSEPWASPSAMQLNFDKGGSASIPEVMSPPLSPPSNNLLGPPRPAGKQSALKLITSFGDGAPKTKFFNDGQTPIAAGITPIAESAVSPAGYDPSTAFLRPSKDSRFNTPITARPSDRFPSIGESLLAKKHMEEVAAKQSAASANTPATYKNENHLPSPDSNIIIKMHETRTGSNGPRDRMPIPLKLQLAQEPSDVISPASSTNRFHWPSRRRGPGSMSSSVTGSMTSGSALNTAGMKSTRSNVSGRSVEDYISSLDAAKAAAAKTQRQEIRGRRRDASQTRDREGERERSEDRGRQTERTWTKPKLSPTSPIPMSPADLASLSARDASNNTPQISEPGSARKTPVTKTSSRASSNRRGEDGRPSLRIDTRGRTSVREGSAPRSPSSPVPMKAHFEGSEDEEDYLKAVEDQENFRIKRSTSRTRGTPDIAPPSAGPRHRSQSGGGAHNTRPGVGSRAQSTEHAGDLRKMKDERQLKKEAAARELEERRKSLAQRTMMSPAALHPGTTSESDAHDTTSTQDERQDSSLGHRRQRSQDQNSPPLPMPPSSAQSTHSSNTSPSQRSMFSNGRPMIGLPATPRAMRLILNPDVKHAPNMPGVPASLFKKTSPESAEPAKDGGASPEAKSPEMLLLPSTVYQPPARSMSAPIPEPTLPRHMSPGQFSTPGGTPAPAVAANRSTRGQVLRNTSAPDVAPLAPQAYERRPSYTAERRPSHNDRERPPLLKELQHLASPPPPPPMPFYQVHKGSRSVIEVYRDDEETAAPVIERIQPGSQQPPPQQQYHHQTSATPEIIVPHTIISRPGSVSGGKGHSRGRSLAGVAGDTITSKISRATTRLRSQSRTRKEQAAIPRSAEHMQVSPYESIPPFMVQSAPRESVIRSPANAQGYPTGLHRSEMI